jgi:multicomponent Na+:H+ antiporter subunit B
LKTTGTAIILFFGGLLIYSSMQFPTWGNPRSPASTHISPYYIQNAIRDTATPNVVTSVLADYRSYDTMFETIVIFASGVACIFLLKVVRRKEPESRLYRHVPTGITIRISKDGKFPSESGEFERIDSTWVPHDLIITTTSRLVIPFIQLFALYVVAHGHHSPGGGFQGGVILGASFILFAISFNLKSALNRMGEKATRFLCALGVFFYAGIGAVCLILKKNFLDYSALASATGLELAVARSLGILLVEIGVAISVMAVMVGLYYSLSSAGFYEEGL